jgi:hypothetical protein
VWIPDQTDPVPFQIDTCSGKMTLADDDRFLCTLGLGFLNQITEAVLLAHPKPKADMCICTTLGSSPMNRLNAQYQSTRAFQPQSGVQRYGFQGQEVQGDFFEGSIHYRYRFVDSRIGRFNTFDPLFKGYPYYSTYSFSGNRVLDRNELEGLETGPTYWMQYSPAARSVGITPINWEQAHSIKDSQSIHFMLDGIGMFPVIGEPADAINGGIYLLEGNYEDASLTFAAMVPIVGWGATATKWARNALKFSDNAFHSSSGLVFKHNKYGNRLSHVMEHTTNDLAKPIHGVFNVGEGNLVGTLDEAWEIAQKGGDNVTKTVQENGNVSYVIDMGREIGFEGGSKGSGDALSKINIVVEQGSSDVVTAFPTK